jgi:hypothetical protein
MFRWLFDNIKAFGEALLQAVFDGFQFFMDAMDGVGQGFFNTVFNVANAAMPTLDLTTDSDVVTLLAGVNYLVPLTEATGFALTWLSTWGAILLYKTIKSWLPTVSGS